MSRVVTGDESWVYGCDLDTKQQSSHWKSPGSPRPKKARQSCSATKSMLIVFYDIRGIVHHEFAPEGQTVNTKFYCNILRCLREDIWRKWPELWRVGNWLLHSDNTPSHRALVTCEFITRNIIITLPHPPYQIWPLATSSSSRRWSWSWRVTALSEWRRSSGNRRMFLVRFENRTSSTHSSSGNGTGIDVSLHKGIILKGMLPKLKSSKCILVYRASLVTFWYTPIYSKAR